MKVPKQPRYEYAISSAIGFILKRSIDTLPVSAGELLRESGRELPGLGGETGRPNTAGRGLLPLMSDGERASARRDLSLMRELAHVELGHYGQFDMAGLSARERAVLDREADCWAMNVKAPAPIVNMITKKFPDADAARIFGMTLSAWRERLDRMEKDRSFIDPAVAGQLRLRFSDFLFRYECRDCGIRFLNEHHPRRCPLCASRSILWMPQQSAERSASQHRARRSRHTELLSLIMRHSDRAQQQSSRVRKARIA